jgi:hypothetical protein
MRRLSAGVVMGLPATTPSRGRVDGPQARRGGVTVALPDKGRSPPPDTARAVSTSPLTGEVKTPLPTADCRLPSPRETSHVA